MSKIDLKAEAGRGVQQELYDWCKITSVLGEHKVETAVWICCFSRYSTSAVFFEYSQYCNRSAVEKTEAN